MKWKMLFAVALLSAGLFFVFERVGPALAPVEEGKAPPTAPTLSPSASLTDGSVFLGVLRFEGSGRYGTIVEVNRAGEVVWKYLLPESINPKGTGLLDVQPTDAGTILFSVRGSGFYEVNRAGEIVWSFEDPRASHDIDLLENGNLLVTYTWAKKGEALAAEITREGMEVWTFDGLSLFSKPKYEDFTDEIGAWAHVNTVERLSTGATMIVVRNFNTVVEVSSTGEVQDVFQLDAYKSPTSLSSQGLLRGSRPHGATRQPYENHLTVITRSPNRVVEFDLTENKIVRAWWGHTMEDDYRKVRDVIPLPKGHWLFTAPRILFELDANNQVVWWYAPPLDPVDKEDARPFFKSVFRAVDGTLYGN